MEQPDRKIPAHRSRHDFSLAGADVIEGGLAVGGYVDRGTLTGKRIACRLDPSAHRRDIAAFAEVASVPRSARASKQAFVTYLNDEGASVRFSALVLKRVEQWMEGAHEWIEVDSPPCEPARFRYRYRLTAFEEARGESDLFLDGTFWERRQRVKRKRNR